ncbi:hypothetical protein ONS96_005815 [Cadophora gregata f. sp. sojae]|nr:hypothetical protein ONS96_005815 [Cadophora gregata f. sp. sojae]
MTFLPAVAALDWFPCQQERDSPLAHAICVLWRAYVANIQTVVLRRASSPTSRTSMPKSKVTCPYCSKLTDTGHIREHINSCQKRKVVCKQYGKAVARIRGHQYPPPKPHPHPQLSAHLDLDEHDWRSKYPLEFENRIKALSSLDEYTISL